MCLFGVDLRNKNNSKKLLKSVQKRNKIYQKKGNCLNKEVITIVKQLSSLLNKFCYGKSE